MLGIYRNSNRNSLILFLQSRSLGSLETAGETLRQKNKRLGLSTHNRRRDRCSKWKFMQIDTGEPTMTKFRFQTGDHLIWWYKVSSIWRIWMKAGESLWSCWKYLIRAIFFFFSADHGKHFQMNGLFLYTSGNNVTDIRKRLFNDPSPSKLCAPIMLIYHHFIVSFIDVSTQGCHHSSKPS